MRKVTLAGLALPAERLDPLVLGHHAPLARLRPSPACVVSRQREGRASTNDARAAMIGDLGRRRRLRETKRVVSRGWRRYGPV